MTRQPAAFLQSLAPAVCFVENQVFTFQPNARSNLAGYCFFIWLIDASTRKEYYRPSPLLIVCLVSIPEAPGVSRVKIPKGRCRSCQASDLGSCPFADTYKCQSTLVPHPQRC
ncbi:hypothetical protein CABS01_10693 [Colletotrichum abscissum]|uniref:uncharacterized protein n=1 Tax=Colletotrichum abscissum TaxID=1671311 RepID=UPI0027D48387|nr:uncharacterized protein CABS01_10693 [Colletotrichum abscissum]KAK1497715.1 hypothetical protein CABS01_10693 [Colletotrichum abscissum]